MQHYKGLLEESTLEVVKVFRDRSTQRPTPVELKGLREGLIIIDCDRNGTPVANLAEVVRGTQWGRVTEERSRLTAEPVLVDGTYYAATIYAIEGYKDAVAENEPLDVITAGGETVTLEVEVLKTVLRAYRQRKKALSDASWAVETKLKQSASPGKLDVVSMLNEELAP